MISHLEWLVSVHCYYTCSSSDSSLMFRQHEVGIVFTIYVQQHGLAMHIVSAQVWSSLDRQFYSTTATMQYHGVLHTLTLIQCEFLICSSQVEQNVQFKWINICSTIRNHFTSKSIHPSKAMYVRQQGVSPLQPTLKQTQSLSSALLVSRGSDCSLRCRLYSMFTRVPKISKLSCKCGNKHTWILT